MANKTLETVMIKEILRLKLQGKSNKSIALAINSSRTTVIKYLKLFEASGKSLEALERLPDEDLQDLLSQPHTDNLPLGSDHRQRAALDFYPYMEKELSKVGATRLALWQEYRKKHSDGYEYSQFCHYFQRYKGQRQAYMHQDHKAGDKLFVDFAGKKLPYIDPETGEVCQAEVFVAVLGASQKTYVQACRSQQLADYIDACQNALYYFGGVPAAIVTDNLRAGVSKSSKYEPQINENFAAFARHFDTTILATRSRKPKDKSLAENGVRIVYHRIYYALSKQHHIGLSALNRSVRELLTPYNQALFRNRDYSRNDLFESVDRPALGALPTQQYLYKSIKHLMAQKNCHIYLSENKHYYSVPFRYVGLRLKVVYTLTDVEIYYNHRRVASHLRSYRQYGYTTKAEHMPSTHQFVSEWSPEKFISWAQAIGPNCYNVIKAILEKKHHPEQSYKSCLGILSMAKKVGNTRVENACKRAHNYNACNYTSVNNILSQGLDKDPEPVTTQTSLPLHHNIRGQKYYS